MENIRKVLECLFMNCLVGLVKQKLSLEMSTDPLLYMEMIITFFRVANADFIYEILNMKLYQLDTSIGL